MMWGWWANDKLRTHVATYKNERDANRDMEAAVSCGWMVQGTAATDGHVNVGRTLGKVAAFGVPFLLTGASRNKGKIVITYVRTPEWLALHGKK
jgi:hypothetical protein